MRQIIGSVILAALAAISGGAAAQTAFAPVVVVNDDVITYYDVEQRARLMTLGGAEPSPQLNGAALEGLINDQLRLQAAERFRVDPDEEQVAQGFAEFGQRYGMDPVALDSGLASAGVDKDSLERLVRAQVAWRALVNGRFGSRATPSELELDSEIELAAAGRTSSYRISEIIISGAQGQEAQARATAERAMARLRSGASFAEVARRFSDSPSRQNGGDVGWVPESALPPAMVQMIAATPPGQFTQPVQTPGGFGIFLVADTREEAPPWAQDAQMSLRRITIEGDDDAALERANSLRDGAAGCESIPDLTDGMSMDSIDQKLVRNLPGPVRGAVQLLQAGQASPPLRAEGKYEVFVVCDRTGGVDAEARNRLREQIRNQRLARMAEGFLQDLRREAVIERR